MLCENEETKWSTNGCRRKPFERLVTGITCLSFGRKILYLSYILGLFNSEIVAYSIGEVQDTSLVLDTLNQLTNLSERVILHSDQSSVYTISAAYQEAVKRKDITMNAYHIKERTLIMPQSDRFIPY